MPSFAKYVTILPSERRSVELLYRENSKKLTPLQLSDEDMAELLMFLESRGYIGGTCR